MEFEHTQRNQEELETPEELKKKKLEELKANLVEFHPARVGLHAERILRDHSVLMSPDEPSDGPLKVISSMGLGAILLTALALEREE